MGYRLTYSNLWNEYNNLYEQFLKYINSVQ